MCKHFDSAECSGQEHTHIFKEEEKGKDGVEVGGKPSYLCRRSTTFDKRAFTFLGSERENGQQRNEKGENQHLEIVGQRLAVAGALIG
jgi:hypothetical protein